MRREPASTNSLGTIRLRTPSWWGSRPVREAAPHPHSDLSAVLSKTTTGLESINSFVAKGNLSGGVGDLGPLRSLECATSSFFLRSGTPKQLCLRYRQSESETQNQKINHNPNQLRTGSRPKSKVDENHNEDERGPPADGALHAVAAAC